MLLLVLKNSLLKLKLKATRPIVRVCVPVLLDPTQHPLEPPQLTRIS